MPRVRRGLSLAPAGLVLERLESALGVVLVFARSPSQASNWPSRGTASRAVHSRHRRTLSDLPSHGHVVRIWLQVRRFRCGQPSCRQKIFAERLDESIARPFGRRTTRLERIVHHVGLALGGRPGQSLARRLLLPVSKDTLLRVVRHHAMSRTAPPRIVGIDDWAWKRGHRYGTIVCDLERRRIIDLLPDREAATVQSWLAARPSIAVIARDRGGGYGQAAARGRPEALQVADRWHLMENASAAFLAALRPSMRPIREALRAGVVDPDRLTSSELRQYNGWQRREEANAMIRALAKGAVPIKEIVRRTGHARGVVRQVVRGGRTDVFRPRASSLEPFLGRLEAEWAAGCRNGAELWRRLRAAGFSGALRVVTEWTTRRRADDATTGPRRAPSARAIARMMTAGADRLSRSEAAFVVAIEAAVPALVAARDLMDQFHRLIRRRDGAALDPWLENAASGLLASFAAGIARDRNAVRAAIVEPWSNGQTEGQITKLKLVKRQMYGRAKLDLLRARLLGAA